MKTFEQWSCVALWAVLVSLTSLSICISNATAQSRISLPTLTDPAFNAGTHATSAEADAATKPAAAAPPNIVLIIADDMGAEDWGGGGNAIVRTPNLDQLARGGLSFTKAMLTCSSCSPSRSSIITCRYPHNTDAEQLHWPLPAAQVTFVELLKRAGYYTAASGKWHLGKAIKDRFHLVDEASSAGFQLPAGNVSSGRTAMEDQNNTSGCANWVRVIQERPRDKPFFLWLAAIDPHRDYAAGILDQPHRPKDVIVPPYLPDVPSVRSDIAMYYDEITRLDSYVGKVLEELERQNVVDNTLVVFISDNGRPFPRCKTTLYDSGIRTPMIVRWPAHIAAGTQSNRLVSTLDLGVTFLELAGLELAKIDSVKGMQGHSMVALLDDPTADHRTFAFAEHNWHDYDAFGRSVRSERYKYIVNYDTNLALTPPADAVRSATFQTMRQLRDSDQLSVIQQQCFSVPRESEEFYDLETDPQELKNRLEDASLATELAAHRAALATWRDLTGDRHNVRAPDEFDRETGEPFPSRKRPRPSKASLQSHNKQLKRARPN